ncbi:hypothetical protein J5N97_018985 [Dioscorea zingiberensis]|uniref:UvrD-like helicase ATP-binding domain-containing protein n=1 Tax=Dioscorea zingiberensis TaxID=325984 RepID=A0A9D5HBZ5_9LILI|nr:hypothetical protein J5N97_018985 [Dioscorea zingiberensis]
MTLPEDLVDLVFSWSLEDILDHDLYKDKVKKIPKTFESVNDYADSFVFPLMEEVRFELYSALETIERAPHAKILSFEETSQYGQSIYDVDVHDWENASANRSAQDYKPLPGDILIISNIRPETVDDLNRYGVHYIFASITEMEYDSESTKRFKVRASKSFEFDEGMDKFSLFAVFLLNILPNSRIWKSLGSGYFMSGNLGIVKQVLSADSVSAEDCDLCISENVPEVRCNVNSELNESQVAAMVGSIKEMQCSHKCSVKLIWGPPGTGKTKTISELLWILLEMKRRVVTCSPTNTSIVEVASRFFKLVKNRRQAGSMEVPSFCRLGDIVLFGNKDRLKIDDDLREIFLDDRVDRLAKCFAPISGWHNCIISMIDFLEKCVTLYEIYIENEKSKEKVEDIVIIPLLKFTRERLNVLTSALETCIENLCIHMPPTFISLQSTERMMELLDVLHCLKLLISEASLGDNEIREVFTELETVEMPTGLLSKNNSGTVLMEGNVPFQLRNARSQCLRLLKYLQETVSIPKIWQRKRIKELCLENTPIIFCTSSSSFLLHFLKMQPLDLLVIDEASQLKECEAIIPLRLCGAKHAVLIGDEHQLPATVKSEVAERADFGRSLFERLSLLGHPKHLLEIQYRMHPSISSFPNSQFYSGDILDGPNVKTKAYERRFLSEAMFGPYSFINISDGKEERDDSGSRRNMVEVGVVVQIVQRLLKVLNSSKDKFSIGIVSPYSSQVAAISRGIGSINVPIDNVAVKVNSVDGFQGGEEDIIILSTVRSNRAGEIGFLAKHQRANVALTRARHCLWIVGNAATLKKSDSVWAALVHNSKKRGCYFDAVQNQTLARAILKIQKEQNQIDDMLGADHGLLIQSAKWKVLFSDEFRKSFAKVKAVQIKMELIHMLLRIANGWRPSKEHLDATDSFKLSRVYQFKDLYLVWSVDIIQREKYIQILKIWNLLPKYEIPKFIKRLDNIFSTYTDEYVEHCRAKQVEGKLEVPRSWNIVQYITRYKKLCKVESLEGLSCEETDAANFLENSKVNESLLLMKFYSLSAGMVEHLLTADDGTEIEIPFELTDEEEEIIRFHYSSFILGRSGTGKTTILTMKLFQKEQQQLVSSHGFLSMNYDASSLPPKDIEENSGNFLRQVFVTVSPKLCSAVRNQIFRLKRYATGEDFSSPIGITEMHDLGESIAEFSEIPDSFHDLPQKHYPLIITFRKLLLMLDGTIMNSFFDRLIGAKEFPSVDEGIHKSLALEALIQSKEVNFEHFLGSYWPHFNNQLTKKLDPSTVFAEIISHIKGGCEGYCSHDVELMREDYIMLSDKRVSSLSVEQRERIYDIFLDYETKKRMNVEFDLSDLVMDLHHRIQSHGYMGDKMDFIYIDEVQDLTMRQIALFKCISSNYGEGFVFAGDTAQTIAKGINFRFEDIRSLFYKEFRHEPIVSYQQSIKGRVNRISDKFQLNQNFRTHDGVLKLAQSVIDLLYEYFPLSVDKLSPETSLVYGEAPMLLHSGNDENAIMTIFGDGGKIGHGTSGFGAEQAILVRDESSKQQILKHVGKQALVLTIVECKGLEFQDVLLYGFFGTSPLKNQWRVIYGYMKEHTSIESSKLISFPSFDEAKHNILCSELKQLYVAITRTRQRLWICETTEEYCQPVFDYWKSLCLVQERSLDCSFAETMRSTSSPEEWKARGIKLFNERNFEMATMCFERAGDEYREKWAKAAGLCATADRVISVNFEMGQMALKSAAEIYEVIGKAELAASCFIKLNDFKTAGMIYLEKCGTSKLESAGDCFVRAECWLLAAETYAKANCLSKCLSSCTTGGHFDIGLTVLEQWRASLSSDDQKHQEIEETRITYLKHCAQHYYNAGNINQMMAFIRALHSIDLIRPFLKSLNLLDELLILEVESKNYLEAAGIARDKGDILLEAEMLEKAGHCEKSCYKIICYVIVKSLWSSGTNGWPFRDFSGKDVLLMQAKSLAKKVSCSFYDLICLEAEMLSKRATSLLDLSELLNASLQFQNVRLEIFSIRMILDMHLQSDPSKFFPESEVVFCENHVDIMISQSNLCVHTLVHFWNLWKDKMSSVLSYVHSLDRHKESQLSVYEEFCLTYFGVWKDKEDTYVMMDSKASWITCKKVPVLRNKYLAWMNANCFRSSAQGILSEELVLVGLDVLDKLKSLHTFSSKKYFPTVSRWLICLSLYETSKYLKEVEFVLQDQHVRKTEEAISFCKRILFDNAFPVEWRNDSSECILDLHGNSSAREIIELIVDDNLKPQNGRLTHGQIGRVAMLLLVIGRVPDEFFEKTDRYLSEMEAWKDFFKAAQKYFTDSFSRKNSFVPEFQKALSSTFEVNWKNELDYISPNCFLYLLENLLFTVSCCNNSASAFFTTKSSLCQFISCQSFEGLLVARPTDALFNNSVALGYISNVTTRLLKQKKELRDWMFTSSISLSHFKSLVLRLVNILILVFLNDGRDMSLLVNLLRKGNIISELPSAFMQRFPRAGSGHKCDGYYFCRLFLDAMDATGNPLVVICSSSSCLNFSGWKAIFIDLEKINSRDDVLATLFPKIPEKEKKLGLAQGIGQVLPNEMYLGSNDRRDDGNSDSLLPSSSSPLDEPHIPDGEHAKDKKYFREKYNSFWEMLEVLLSETGKSCSIAKSHFYNAGERVFEGVFCVLEDVKGLMNQEGLSDSYGDVLGAMVHRLLLLKEALAHPSEKDDAANHTTDEELVDLCIKLQETKLKLQPLMDKLFSLSSWNISESAPHEDQNNTEGKPNNIKTAADQSAVSEAKAVGTDGQKSKGKHNKSRKKGRSKKR